MTNETKNMSEIYASERSKKISIGVIFALLGIIAGSYMTDYVYKHNNMKDNTKSNASPKALIDKPAKDKALTYTPGN